MKFKRSYLFPLLALCLLLAFTWNTTKTVTADGDVLINATNFPDVNFRNYVSRNFDTDANGILSTSELEAVLEIQANDRNIASLKGEEFFTKLKALYVYHNELTQLNVSKNTELKTLSCYSNQLTALDVGQNTALISLDCGDNKLTKLDVSHNPELESFYCTNNQLTTLDVSHNTKLAYFFCNTNHLEKLDVSSNLALIEVDCSRNDFSSLDFRNNKQLKILDCSYNLDLTSLECSNCSITDLNVFNCTALDHLLCGGNALTELDLSSNTALETLGCANNALTTLDLSSNTALTGLMGGDNPLTELNLGELSHITYLSCHNCALTSLDVSHITELQVLLCSDNLLSTLDVSNNKELIALGCSNNALTTLNVTKNPLITELYCYSNKLKSLLLGRNTEMYYCDCEDNCLSSLNIGGCPIILDTYQNGTKTLKNEETEYWCYELSDEKGRLSVDPMTRIITEYMEPPVRIFGETRYQTSIKIADMLKEVRGVEKFQNIILVYGQAFPDGLSASYLAAVKNAPIITTDGSKPSRYEPAQKYVLENLARGGTVYIIGGESAVSETAVKDLLHAVHCVRLSGNTRYLTNIAVLEEAGVPDRSEVLIATGSSFPDSLSVSSTGLPLLLVNGNKGTLTDSQKSYLKSLGAKKCRFTIIGGTAAISNDMKTLIESCTGVKADRVEGGTRYTTSTAIAERYFPETDKMVLCYGENFPDALCAGPLGAALDAPIVLMRTGKIKPLNAVMNYASSHNIHEGYVLGGTTLITDDDVRKILGLEDDIEIVVR